MTKELRYLIFAIEEHKKAYNLSGKEVYEVFTKYDFFSYIVELYELLHIQGQQYLFNELEKYRVGQTAR
ncbi:MAG: DUF3791 domain-containing protein [Firmicutes bacterium]|nr:DUF3791 domain-containing protein [Bacillota bacterium]